MDREYPPAKVESTRATLEAWLDYERDGVLAKVDGLSDLDASRSPVGTGTSITGLVRHLALVERYWFPGYMIMRDYPPTNEDFDAAAAVTAESSLSEAMRDYVSAITDSRTIQIEIKSLETASPVPGDETYLYGWILTHMIEETARHLGHLDILREIIDGAVGQ